MAAKQRNPEMEALMNSGRTETLSTGRVVHLFAVPWMHAARFTAAAEPIFKLFLGDEPEAAPLRPAPHPDIPAEVVEVLTADVAPAKTQLSTEEIMLAILKEHSPAIMDLCECCTDMDRESLGYLQLDDAIAVAGGVIEVNMSFFKQRLQGRLPALLAKLLGGITESGSTAQPD